MQLDKIKIKTKTKLLTGKTSLAAVELAYLNTFYIWHLAKYCLNSYL
jgi:hypothetical protein